MIRENLMDLAQAAEARLVRPLSTETDGVSRPGNANLPIGRGGAIPTIGIRGRADFLHSLPA